MLDTSLGNDIDAPYFVLGESIRPTLTESEFTGCGRSLADTLR